MTKRLFTAENILEADDDDLEYDDPGELMMKGSDYEFSDLEVDDDNYQLDLPPDLPDTPLPSSMSQPNSSSSALPLQLPPPFSPSHSPPPSAAKYKPKLAKWTTILTSVTVKPFNPPVGPLVTIPESPKKSLLCSLALT